MYPIEIVLIVITLGSFFASAINVAFATGGVFLLLTAATAVLPTSAAIPLMSVFAFSSLVARVAYYYKQMVGSIVLAFAAGAIIGVFFGSRVFVSLNEAVINILLGVLLLVLIWVPTNRIRIPMKHPFMVVGALHAFLGTIFGVGTLLQPSILRTNLLKAQITGTLAACLITMDMFKIVGYVSVGFDYFDYIPHIILATIAGFAGSWAGKRFDDMITERTFRIVFKWVITLMAIRLLVRGLLHLG